MVRIQLGKIILEVQEQVQAQEVLEQARVAELAQVQEQLAHLMVHLP